MATLVDQRKIAVCVAMGALSVVLAAHAVCGSLLMSGWLAAHVYAWHNRAPCLAARPLSGLSVLAIVFCVFVVARTTPTSSRHFVAAGFGCV